MSYQQGLLVKSGLNLHENAGFTPLLPKLLEELHRFKRDAVLTQEELVMLYQIKTHTESFIKQGVLPP